MGEARNPGPGKSPDLVTVLVSNVSSLLEHLDHLVEDSTGAYVLQEVRGSPEAMDARLRTKGCTAVWGALDEHGHAWTGHVAKGGNLKRLELPFLPTNWSHRVVAALWAPAAGPPISLVSIYGVTSAVATEKEELNEVLLHLVEMSEQDGGHSWLIGGDLNMELSDHPMASWLHTCGWKDAGSEPTCLASRTRVAKRIDVVLANRFLQPSVAGYKLSWDSGLLTHAAQYVTLAVGQHRLHQVWQPGRKHEAPKLTPAQMEALGTNLASSARLEWEQACGSGVDAMWDVIEQLAREYHCLAAGTTSGAPMRGRSKMQAEVPMTIGDKGDACTMELQQLAKRKRQLQHLAACVRKATGATRSAEEQLRAALTKHGSEEFCAQLQAATTEVQLELLIGAARREEDTALARKRHERKGKWHEWLRTGWADDQRKLYRWIRKGPEPVPLNPPTQREDGSWRVGLQRQVEKAEEAWWKLRKGPELDEEAARQMYAPLRQVPAMPERTPMTGASLQRAGQRMSRSKAPWADDWAGSHLRLWPRALWDWVAVLLHKVEECGEWPQRLRHSVVALLPNGGDRRSLGLQAGGPASPDLPHVGSH